MSLSTSGAAHRVPCSLPLSISSVSRQVRELATVPDLLRELVKRQDVFGKVGDPASLIDRIVDFSQAPESYRAFDKGEIGKVVFDPWK
jgi:hypothetical protein